MADWSYGFFLWIRAAVIQLFPWGIWYKDAHLEKAGVDKVDVASLHAQKLILFTHLALTKDQA